MAAPARSAAQSAENVNSHATARPQTMVSPPPGRSNGWSLKRLNAKDGHCLWLTTLTSLRLQKKPAAVLRAGKSLNAKAVVSQFVGPPPLGPRRLRPAGSVAAR